MAPSRLESVSPRYAIGGARVSLHGAGFQVGGPRLPAVTIDALSARVVFASPTRIDVVVPAAAGHSGHKPIHVDGADESVSLEIGMPVATGLHQVDSPAIDASGNLFLTYSGTRDQQVPVSIFRVDATGTRETYSSGVPNPTSLAIAPNGQLFVSSRFEGIVYRVSPDGTADPFATDLGIACGLVFGPDGTLYVGDRGGTIFAVDGSGKATRLASLPASVAAFHLALGRDALYVAAPTLAPRDHIYRVTLDGQVSVFSHAFGRPQGLAFDAAGVLFAVDALAGAGGLYRLSETGVPTQVVAGSGLIGAVFDRQGALTVCTTDTAYRFPVLS